MSPSTTDKELYHVPYFIPFLLFGKLTTHHSASPTFFDRLREPQRKDRDLTQGKAGIEGCLDEDRHENMSFRGSTEQPKNSQPCSRKRKLQQTRPVAEQTPSAPPTLGPRGFLDLPPELRNEVYARCIQWPHINISHIKKSAFDGLSESHPMIAKEWADFWCTNNIFLLDVRSANCVGKSAKYAGTNDGETRIPKPIVACMRWLKGLEDRQLGLLRTFHIWTDYFVAKLYISVRHGEASAHFELCFRDIGVPLRDSRQARHLTQILQRGFDAVNEALHERSLKAEDVDFLAQKVLKLAVLCCSIFSSARNGNRLGAMDEHHVLSNCPRCEKFRLYLA